MAGRILTVRDRCLRAVRTHLAGITRANGYEFDVRRVTTPATIQLKGNDPPEIHLLPGTNREKIRNVCAYWGLMPLKAMMYLRQHTTDPDLEMSLFAGQVRRRILEGMVDPTGTGHHSIELNLDYGFDYRRFLDVPNEVGQLVGVFGFEVKYSYLSNDDRKWDTNDTHVTE